jgi:hypothetical protein
VKLYKKRKKYKSRRAKRGSYISKKCLKEIHYRSSWELFYAIYLDNNEKVISYSYEPYSISYVSNLKTKKIRKYYPDFEIQFFDGEKHIVEIKPKKKLTQLTNVKKFAAAKIYAQQNNMQYVILTEVELKALGLVL